MTSFCSNSYVLAYIGINMPWGIIIIVAVTRYVS